MRAVVLAPPGNRFADDLCAALGPAAEARGFELAREGTGELVIEIPPGRDSVAHWKPVAEVWRIDPDTRAFEVYRLWADSYDAIGPGADGVVRSPALDVELSVVGGRLRVGGVEI